MTSIALGPGAAVVILTDGLMRAVAEGGTEVPPLRVPLDGCRVRVAAGEALRAREAFGPRAAGCKRDPLPYDLRSKGFSLCPLGFTHLYIKAL